MGLTNVTRMLALACPPPALSAQHPTMPPPTDVVVLKHCRCMDCRNFSKVGGDYFCSEYIGGTSVVWATGKRQCDPPPEAWHYCACYHGPQISKDVWMWPRRSRHVGAGSTIAPEVEQPDEDEELI
jgi:hypothetical protein